MAQFRPAITGHGLDRDDHTRADPANLAAMRARPDARLLSMDGLMPHMDGDALVWTALDAVPDDAELVFLGLKEGIPLFAPVAEKGDTRPAYEQRGNRALLMQLAPRELAIYAGARSLVDWHARHRFCANCGKPTTLSKGGWQRDCAKLDTGNGAGTGTGGCGAPHFPRTDPVAIMLIEHDGDLLLGRGANFPERSYSALAGFIEPGECIEEAVAREVLEEVGVIVGGVTYVASQPWPFPSQLMIGCHGYATGRQLTLDETEIEDARWFTRAEIAEALSGSETSSFRAPPSEAIARTLLEWWMERGV
ncbi:NAD(+) diphosphatase [Aurantiacibacter marinus]|uniref:NAD(+) diphosphatase n=1 Tax=Aurantiacibacter marinus TaxID=874156 RepID=A0A0H0XLL5_9SPHN|nr:NAD(+) diphosphatase [Aurantiacibacter marinus]KLI63483.1 NUDIX hydrolase [Aurantiacibacter marinus]